MIAWEIASDRSRATGTERMEEPEATLAGWLRVGETGERDAGNLPHMQARRAEDMHAAGRFTREERERIRR